MNPGAGFCTYKQNWQTLARLIREKTERAQINKIRNKRGDVATDTTETQRIVRNYYEQRYAKGLDNLDEIDKFLETYDLPNLNQEDTENLNRPIQIVKLQQ